MIRLWQALLRATGPEECILSCEECFLLLDYFAELLAEGHPPERILPVADKVLRRCPDCRAEFREVLDETLAARRGGIGPDANRIDQPQIQTAH